MAAVVARGLVRAVPGDRARAEHGRKAEQANPCGEPAVRSGRGSGAAGAALARRCRSGRGRLFLSHGRTTSRALTAGAVDGLVATRAVHWMGLLLPMSGVGGLEIQGAVDCFVGDARCGIRDARWAREPDTDGWCGPAP